MEDESTYDEFSIFSRNIHTVLDNFILGMCIHTFHAERLGVIAKLLQRREIIFFDNVLVVVVVALASGPQYIAVFTRAKSENVRMVPNRLSDYSIGCSNTKLKKPQTLREFSFDLHSVAIGETTF